VGEALVSFLDAKGTPSMVERAWILPPSSRIGPVTPQEREQVVKSSPVYGHYEQTVDRESAYEKLAAAGKQRMEAAPAPGQAAGTAPAAGGGGVMDVLGGILLGSTGPRGGHKEGMLEAAAKSAARSVGSQVGREILRGVLGGLLGGRKR
jgi:DNA double-strand break repair helicase HerA and related ATPase